MTGPGDRERRDPEESKLSGLADANRKAAPYTAAVSSLVVAVGVFTWLGHYADEKLDNRTPWLTLLGVLVGMIGGFTSFFRSVLGAQKKK
jgi:ATP synthase protein I